MGVSWQEETFLRAGRQLNAKACSLIIIKAKIKYVAYTQRKQWREKKHTRRAQRQLVKVENVYPAAIGCALSWLRPERDEDEFHFECRSRRSCDCARERRRGWRWRNSIIAR